MAKIRYYAVSEAIAEELQLKKIRTTSDDGKYLLSAYDLSSYGIDRARVQGAEELTEAEAKKKFNIK